MCCAPVVCVVYSAFKLCLRTGLILLPSHHTDHTNQFAAAVCSSNVDRGRAAGVQGGARAPAACLTQDHKLPRPLLQGGRAHEGTKH